MFCPSRTVESTTQPPEVSTTQCQSQVKARNENKKQTPNFVSDLKRKLHGIDVVEQHSEHSSRKPRPEKSNSSRDDSASGVSTQNNCKQVKRARTGTPEAALNSTLGTTYFFQNKLYFPAPFCMINNDSIR